MAWPLPALLAWGGAWLVFLAAVRVMPAPWAALAATAAGALCAWRQASRNRRWLVAGGFPVSLMALLAGSGGGWLWLVPLALLAVLYPVRAWRDAPVFPTPPDALQALAAGLPLPPGARILDAGSGLGDGLLALARAWPQARIEGVEWSRPLAWLSRLRCPRATVRSGDMWRPGAWAGLDLVYLFQRPESMDRAWRKACAEMPGGWLLSLEFEVPGRAPDRCDTLAGGRRVMAWRVPGPQPLAARADTQVPRAG